MILRKLEVYGFKSFADRQTLSFASGITAVIGPNGCGKSNVVDAFKWILGEQAPSSLRSKGMSDVIHLDREGKEAVPYAEGSITFDNSTQLLHWDAPEVVVTRRIHRDGRSEYLINNQIVRLRMLRDMFLGTGIGTKSYFVLEQGRITDIIKRSPLERRAIFEEAAGIGRYNQRRREAERKLVGVDDSLNRARDVIAEISRQIRSLRIQAGRARSYNETAAKLRDIRIQAGIIRYRVINAELAEIAERLAAEATEETRARDAEHEAAAARELSQALRQSALEAVHRYRNAQHENLSRVEGWNERIVDTRAQVERLEGQSTEKREESVRIESVLEERRTELAAIDRRHRDASRARRVFTQLRLLKAEELEEALEAAAGVRSEQERLRQEAYERDRERAQLVNKVGAVRVRSGNLEGSLDRLRRRGHELGAQLARIGSDRKAAESRTEELASTLADAQAALAAATDAQQEARGCLKELDRRSAEERVNLKERQGRLGVLKDLEASHAGVGEGARHLLGSDGEAGGKATAGILGLLGESLDLDPRHARAIERALGEDVEALMARDAETALDAADTLKQRSKGGASFWAIGAVPTAGKGSGRKRGKPAWLDPKTESQPGILGWAPEFVKADGAAREAARALLADVVLVEDRAAAAALRDAGHTDAWRLVTLEGEIFGPAARIRAGESVQSGGLISRRAEIRRVAAEIEVLDVTVIELESERAAAETEVVCREREVAEAAERLRTRDLDRAQQIKELDDLRRRERDLEEERRIGDEEADEIGAGIESQRAEEAELGAAIDRIENRLEEIKQREAWLEARQGGAARYLEQMKSEAERVESVGMTLRRREGELQYLKHQVLERISDMDHGRTRLTEEAQKLADWVKRHEAECVRLEEQIEEAGHERKRWESLLAQAETELRSSEDSVQCAAREEEAARRALDDVRSARENDRVREGELKTRLESLLERLREEEDLDLVEAAAKEEVAAREREEAATAAAASSDAPEEVPEEEPDLEALEGVAAQLKRKLDRLGPVNAAAIDELEELEKRERFYLAQEEDLIASKKSLEDIIRRINKRSRQIFLETFNTVRAEFRTIFRRLFGGGRGDIRLLDEENVLESGVEIVAQPPEKGAKSLDMLSGGEKVMTTTALLFAIFTARPCPFCLLDEIDAALDEANIQRFLAMVNSFLEKTQFIIVTHNKRTIAEADVIHGITMPKAGQSRRVSVQFENGELKTNDAVSRVFALERARK